MEAANVMPSPNKLVEAFGFIFFETLLILAAIGANDNRFELEADETERKSPYLALSEGVASGELLETVTVEQR
ncbi:MAG: hypothetical protein Q7K41_00480 [Dehalococcoidales bacterium]|nr:hypothetical protein [Dehalococcoidales bacterium]